MDRQIGRRFVIGGACLLAGLILWFMRNVASSWAADTVVVNAGLTTPTEHSSDRLRRAFAAARQAHPADVALQFERDQIHSTLSVRAHTASQAISQATALTDAMNIAFEKEGPGWLWVSLRRRAIPVEDANTTLVWRLFVAGAVFGFLLGVYLLVTAWTRVQAGPDRMPAVFWWQISFMLFLPVAVLVAGAGIMIGFIMLIPTAIAIKLCHNVEKTSRAAKWPSTTARVTKSALLAKHKRQASDVTEVVNMPSVEYEFTVGGTLYHGSRIRSVEGVGKNTEVQATLDRYPVGATVPVHYNPDNPSEAVLEYDLPLPAPVIYAIAGAIFMAGVGAAAVFIQGDVVISKLRAVFPRGAEPQFALFFGVGAILILFILLANYRNARRAASWPVASGHIVSSRVESYVTTVGSARTGNRVRLYQAVVEYAYQVNDRTYHSTQLSFGGKASTPQAPAEAKAARYPVGSQLMVRYDPRNPSNAVVDTKVSLGWFGLLLVALFIGLALHFSAVFR